jgi:hypothetical protein
LKNEEVRLGVSGWTW